MLRSILEGVRAAVLGKSLSDDINDEIRFHLERRADEFRREGLSKRDAALAAQRRFGDVNEVSRACQQANHVHPSTLRKDSIMRDLLQDLRLTLRLARRSPGFVIVAILTMALGIGANSAVFTAVNSVLLSPLPYDEPEQLISLYMGWTQEPRWRGTVAGLDFLDYREGLTTVEHLAAAYTYREQGLDLMGPTGPMRIRALPVSSGYFETFRATPLLGRTFRVDEETDEGRVVILAHGFWRNTLDSDSSVIGSGLTLDDVPYTVVGVMRSTFSDVNTGNVDVWIPQDLRPGGLNSRDNLYLSAVGRLQSGFTVEQAQAQLDGLHAELTEQFPQSNSWKIPWMIPMHADVVRESGTMLYVLMGASALVLLIACVNVGNIALARGMTRRRELSLRLVLGARRSRLARQLITESTVIAGVGGLVGVLVAFAGIKALLAVSPDSLARAEEIAFDSALVTFTVVVTLAAGVLFGLAPYLAIRKGGEHGALRESTRHITTTRKHQLGRAFLVTVQVSLAVMLLVGSGLLMRSFVNLQRIDMGYQPEGVTTFEVHLPDARYETGQARIQFYHTLHDRVATIPGVQSIGAASWLPVNGLYHQWGLRWDGAGGDRGFAIQVRVIEGDFFETFRIPLLRGRTFGPRDQAETESVALLNETAARMAFEDGTPLGRAISVGGHTWSVIGVVGDVAHTAQGDTGPKVYLSHSQFGGNRNWDLIQVVSTMSDGGDVIAAVREELRAIDPQLVVYRPRTMTDIAARQIARERFAMTLMAVFSCISLTLAAVGLYGVLSYSVTQRFHELGIRMALGARSSQVVQIVGRQAFLLITVGMSTGMGGAIVLGRFLESLTFRVSVTDPLTLGVVTTIISLVCVVAVALPARRAVAADPVDALRSE